ncbi:isochorismatase family protein [Butyrivibrio sp. WCD3002]|uniref:isochorismatase family protein n=1 Tax=Butyrivibrio sp. WCD3002 TaxID=1280676 RepID=UPI00047E2438|nr:isochorismatase family protein [Butyrivibrio sp. WCD3002]
MKLLRNSQRKNDIKRLLIIIDMQKELIALKSESDPDEANSVVESIKKKIKEFDKDNIIACRETKGDYCQGNPEWEIEDGISKAIYGARIIDKGNDFSYELAKIIEEEVSQTKLEIEIVGALLDRCIISNAFLLRLMVPDAKIRVDLNCCLATDIVCQDEAVRVMERCGIDVL